MVSRHTTSIVDISEIEDDDGTPMTRPGNVAISSSRSNTLHSNSGGGAGCGDVNDNNQNINNHHHHHHHQYHPINNNPSAQFYLYNEDLNPQHRIPHVLSNIINAPATINQNEAGGCAQPGSNTSQQLSPIGPDYNNNNQSNQQALELSQLNGSSNNNKQNRRTPSPYDLEHNGTTTKNNNNNNNNGLGKMPAPPVQQKANLGTLSGVYFPCVQNIFGVILFIRMVWIVGTAGIPAAFSLVFLCCCVTLTTSISLSAIATNGIVPAGGSYHMISRSLGPECGGAVGTMFFLGTTVAGAMYITGAVEIMLNYLCPSWGLFGDFQRDVNILYNNIRVYGTLLLILVGLLVWIGVKFVSKLAPVALLCVLISIASIYAGIFINYNGRPDLMICVMGDRLVTLKNIPYDDPMAQFGGESPFHHTESYIFPKNGSQQHGVGKLIGGTGSWTSDPATMAQLRRTKALCSYEKLRHIYCPGNDLMTTTTNENNNFDNSNPDQLLNSPLASNVVDAQQPIDDASRIAQLFKRQPNMSNCDPYFRANKDRIHLEKAVPGIASGVFWENLKPRFRNSRTIVSYDDGINTNPTNDFNQVFVDISTSFVILIGIYFPSCTGILAGSNRSGDLADAQKSIPKGTISAQLTTSFVYLSCIVLFGSTFNNLFIRDKFGESMSGQLAVTQIAWPTPWVILIGSLLSTLGAALQSLVGAPRVLQKIADDDVIPIFARFAKVSNRGEPDAAILFTLFISWVAVLIGNLDLIAPILTISLVMCYLFINLACMMHSLLGSPNWRPRFKCYHWIISAIGCLLCLFVMLASSILYTIIASFIASCIYVYIHWTCAEKEWGDGKQGLALSAARYHLLRLKTNEPHTKNWRPQLLLLCKLKPAAELEPVSAKATLKRGQKTATTTSGAGSALQNQQSAKAITAASSSTPVQHQQQDNSKQQSFWQQQNQNIDDLELKVAHPKLLTFASQLKAGKGLTLVSSVIEGDYKQLAPLANKARATIQESMNEERVKGFADVVVSSTIADGFSYQIQTAGLGGLKHNTVIVGWPEHWRRFQNSGGSWSRSSMTAGSQPEVANPNATPTATNPHRGSFKSSAGPSTTNQQQQPTTPTNRYQQQKSTSSQQHSQTTRAHLFIDMMRNAQMSHNALVVVKGIDLWPDSCDRLGGYIDIWWIVNDGGLLMLLPHLLRQHKTWKSCHLRIFTIAQPHDNIEQMREDLTKFLYHLRIEAQVDIVELNNADISDYAYERTLMMEQRTEIIKRLNVNRKQSILLEQEIDGRLIKFRIRKPSSCDFEDPLPFQCQQQSPQSTSPSEHLSIMDGSAAGVGSGDHQSGGAGSPPKATSGGSQSHLDQSQGFGPADTSNQQQQQQQEHLGKQNNNQNNTFVNNMMRPNETNVRRMHTALTLNEAILKRSKSAKLVIINLPGAPKDSTPEAENNYMEFIEIITEKLERVLLVQNGGREVITIHS